MNKVERTVKIGDSLVHGVEIDWEKRDRKRIYTPEEEMETPHRREILGPATSFYQTMRSIVEYPVTSSYID